MNIKNIFTPKRIIFLLLFFELVLIGKNINFSSLVGAESQFFTLFQFFGPTAGTFLGPVFGIITVLFSQFADLLIVGKEFTIINVLRLLPMLFAVYYFSSKKRAVSAIISLVCMFLFIIHPIGGEAWMYTLYWLIPFFAVVLPKKVPGQLLFKSFGATFTAHAIGSVLWIYTVPMTAGQWVGLIPVVAYERFLFGMGIAGSYVVFNSVLDYVVSKWKLRVPTGVLMLDKKYTIARLLHFKKV
ncbi:hypothetical protein HOL21_04165 [Candidatus Woesearchaeota archaeon]|nr:hypothetical protein [Candidatus Woesearchaeota archaeon]